MLELKNISYTVEGEKEIINNISFKIDKSKFIVITGPNGSGKSTLAKIIAGIVKPTSGQLILDGKDITDAGISERAKMGISFAFQQPVRFKGVTVKDLITLASSKELSTVETYDYLAQVGLCARDYIDREVNSSLSGGELKRIEIATILARKTKISVFDEPEAGIDIWSFKNLIEVFENIHNEINGAIVIISHQERILNIADEIIVVANGVIAQQGSKEEVLPILLEQDALEFTNCQVADGRKN